jgi:hypothetical protein
MINDPIVEEVHRIREKMLAECGGNLGKLLDRIQAAEAGNPNRVTSVEQLRKLDRSAPSTSADQQKGGLS